MIKSVEVTCPNPSLKIVPAGTVGRTVDRLCGCFVPVVTYSNSVLLGHFGPAYIRTIYDYKKLFDPTLNPDNVEVYSSDLTKNPLFSGEYQHQRYEAKLLEFIDFLMELCGGCSMQILNRKVYDFDSEIVVDWHKVDGLTIFSRPSSQPRLSYFSV